MMRLPRRVSAETSSGQFRLAFAFAVASAVALQGCEAGATPAQEPATEGDLQVETLASGLDTPWDLAWGPDGAIWVTERGGTVSRVDPSSGAVTPVGQLEVHERSESGLMGMAFHPQFQDEPYVYFAHSYSTGDGIENRLVRARFQNGRLGAPEVLLDGIPGRGNHNGSRLAVGPDGYLYMTMGDAGRRDLAQDRSSLAGKILRLTLDGRPAPGNPLGNAVYSYGHRNPQGLVFHPDDGTLFYAEHGPSDNDEVGRVRTGGDHGWPAVHGRCDGDTDGEMEYCRANQVAEPFATWTPTVGIAGMDYYGASLIPGWEGSLLVTSLRGATLYRVDAAAEGSGPVEPEAFFEDEYGRLRDVLVGPDGAVYVAVSNRDGRGQPADEDDRILKITPRGT